jgi:hypothetical protein
MNQRHYLWPDNHYGKNNRKLMAENRGELHLGEEGPEEHAEYIVSESPFIELAGQSNKHPTKGNSKG